MLSLDLFDSKYERKLHEGAVDDAEYARLKTLGEKIDYLKQARAKTTDPEMRQAIDGRIKEYNDERMEILSVRGMKEAEQPQRAPTKGLLKGKDLVTPQQRVAGATPPKPGVAGAVKDVAGGIKRWLRGEPDQGPTYEAYTDPAGQVNPKTTGNANMGLLIKANSFPQVRPVTFEFPTVGAVPLDAQQTEVLSDYYDGLGSSGAQTHFIYNVLSSYEEVNRLMTKLGAPLKAQAELLPAEPGSQGQLPLSEKKKSQDEPELKAGDVKVARELQKLRAQYPAARSDVEAVARAEIDSSERSRQQIAAIRGANEKQDSLLKQLVALDREQGKEIDNLDQENDTLDQQLAQVQATNDRLQQTIAQMTGTKTVDGSNVINLIPGAPADTPAPQQKPKTKQQVQPKVEPKTEPKNIEPTPKEKGPEVFQQMTRTITAPQNVGNLKSLRTQEPDNDAQFQLTGTEESVKEHGGGIGPRQHWQDLMQEGQPQELINRYLAIDAETDVEAVRKAIQAISRDPALGANSKSRLLGQIGMIIKRHKLPIGRAYYQFMQQFMEEQDVEEVKKPAPRTRGEFVPAANSSDSYKAGYDLGVKLARATNMTQVAKTQVVQTQSQQQAMPADFVKGYKKGFSDFAGYIRNQQDIANAANKTYQNPEWRSITPDQVQQIVARYSAGETSPQIASDFGLDAQQILRLIDKQSNRDEIVQLNRQNRKGKIGPQRQLAFDGKQIKEQGVVETALNPKDPKGDYEAKRRALHDLSLNKDVDQAAVLQRRLDLDREAKAKGLAETVTNVKAGMAEIYRRLAPKIERHRDSFLAGQLYDELENYAELHGAEGEFKRMMNGARNRAHMEYDTNPGGFQNWFWFLPFEDQSMTEMDKSQPSQERHGHRPLGAKGTAAKPVAARKVVKDLAMDLDQAFAKQKPVKKKGVAEGLIYSGDTWQDVLYRINVLNDIFGDQKDLAASFEPASQPEWGPFRDRILRSSTVLDTYAKVKQLANMNVPLTDVEIEMLADVAWDGGGGPVEPAGHWGERDYDWLEDLYAQQFAVVQHLLDQKAQGHGQNKTKSGQTVHEQGVAESNDDIKKRMSKLEALALAANRAGDDAKCKMYQQKIQSLKQKLSQSMAEGLSDQGNPTVFSVHRRT
jgi:hypothetical protein